VNQTVMAMLDLDGRVFLFDGSFEGLLTALAAALAQGAESARFRGGGGAGQGGLWEVPVRVNPDPERAAAFLGDVRRRLGEAVAGRVIHLWWAEREELFPPLYDYLRLGFGHGMAVDGYQTHPAVRAVLAADRRVVLEINRLSGLLRFRELADGSLYAPVAPDANVSLALARHFRGRLHGERWLIHDTRRGVGVSWDGHKLALGQVAAAPPGEVAEGGGVYHAQEGRIQELWRGFFAAVAIPERVNPELQRRCMPRRYWEYLVERPRPGGGGRVCL
jgi:probable DNA metabolism protein